LCESRNVETSVAAFPTGSIIPCVNIREMNDLRKMMSEQQKMLSKMMSEQRKMMSIVQNIQKSGSGGEDHAAGLSDSEVPRSPRESRRHGI